MTREQAMEWILPALHGGHAPSHLPQILAGPLSLDNPVGMPAASAEPNAIKLSDEQQYVVDLVKQGYNVFFTGSAGTSHFIPFLVDSA